MLQRIALTTSLVGALALAGTALAGNGAGPNKSSSAYISPPVVVSATSSPTAATATGPSYGDTITFTVSTTEASPFVNLNCYQNGSLVAQGWANFSIGGGTFGLSSGAWTGGAADCTANLDVYSNNKWKVLASTSFHVDA